MKKKILTLLLALTMVLSLAACGGNSDADNNLNSEPESSATIDTAVQADLTKFYESLVSNYGDDFPADVSLTDEPEFLESMYPGLTDLATKQLLAYQPMMSAVVGEIVLIELENGDDMEAAMTILQNRIDYQVNENGAWYPESIEGWANNSRIVTNGNYLMMIAWSECDSAVADFNALFGEGSSEVYSFEYMAPDEEEIELPPEILADPATSNMTDVAETNATTETEANTTSVTGTQSTPSGQSDTDPITLPATSEKSVVVEPAISTSTPAAVVTESSEQPVQEQPVQQQPVQEQPTQQPTQEQSGTVEETVADNTIDEAPIGDTATMSVDLTALYDSFVTDYGDDFPANVSLTDEPEFLDMIYPGLSDISTKQLLAYQPMMSSVVGEIVLVEVENSADIDAVKAILQARIDDQSNGGAWYPESIDGWVNNSRIVTDGNCVMMIAWSECDHVVESFHNHCQSYSNARHTNTHHSTNHHRAISR